MLQGIFGFIFGLVLGSFAKATSERLVRKETIWGRSYCLKCQKKLRWYDLFPLISYILLRGKCRYCQEKIAIDNLLAEFVVALVLAALFILTLPADLGLLLRFEWQTAVLILEVLFKVFIVVVLAIAFLTDLESGYIFDRLTYPAIVTAISFLITISAFKSWVFYQSFWKSPLAPYLMYPKTGYVVDHLWLIWQPAVWALAASVVISLVFILLIIITRGRGMGWGDVKYVFFLGLVLGFANTMVAIFWAFLLGAAFSLGLIIFRKKTFGQTVPFGPFLSIGALVALLWGNELARWYLGGLRF